MKKCLLVITSAIFGLQMQVVSQQNLTWEVFDINKKVSLRSISAVNQKECWVAGTEGTIARTINKGSTWDFIKIPNSDSLDFRDIEVFNSREILILSVGSGDKSKIFKTNDGGKSWRVVFQNTLPEGFFDAFTFWNQNDGLLQGDPINGRLYLVRTSDRGETWLEVPNEQCPKVDEGEYAFAASGSQITSLGQSIWIGTGGSKSRVYRTTTQELDWQSSDTKIIQGESSQGVFSIDFLNEQFGIAVGGDYTKENEGRDNIMLTFDGGDNWRVLGKSLNYRSCVKFVEKTIIVTGPSGSEVSSDMGSSWKKIDGLGFHTLGVDKKTKTVWAAGSDGRVGRLRLE